MWSFVAKKQAHCDPDDPADDHKGDWWDHVLYDAEHRLVLAVVPGARSIENAEKAVTEARDRTAGREDVLFTSDEYPAYETAIDRVYGVPEEPKPPGTPGRRPVEPGRRPPADLTYATVHKEREKGRVVAIVTAVVLEALRGHGDDPGARRLAERLGEVLPRLKRAIGQAERRVLKDDPVPSGEKLVSLFEPHTQVIPRFKAGKPAEFGRKLRLDETEGGIITGYRVFEKGGGQDQEHLADALANHRRQFGRAPRLLAADRGMASAENERLAERAGVKQVALPHVGKAPPERRAEERGRRFREGYRFRAGIEGRIHALKRDFGLRRCRYRGERGFGRWVGWGVVAHNLAKVAGVVRG